MIRVRDREWGTAEQLARRLGPDITPAMVYRWRERDDLETIRIGQTAYSPLDQAATIEASKRRSGRGRPRRVDATPVAA